jgi:Homocysteine S-methyltransferase
LAEANRMAIAQLVDLRSRLEGGKRDIVVSGCIGPRGDGYDDTARMSAQQAHDYHAAQVETFAETAADMVNAMTITYPDEAIGIVRAADQAEVPVAISFTVERDGTLRDGTKLGEAIEWVDDATGGSGSYQGSTVPTRLTSRTFWIGPPLGQDASGASGPTHRVGPIPSSTSRIRWTRVMRSSSARSTQSFAARSRTSRSSEGAAGPM